MRTIFFNTLFRLEARRMKEHGLRMGTTGRSLHSGLRRPGDHHQGRTRNNACSKAKRLARSGARPGRHHRWFVRRVLMQLCRLVFLEDISGELPPIRGNLSELAMDRSPCQEAYRELEDDMRKALKAHRAPFVLSHHAQDSCCIPFTHTGWDANGTDFDLNSSAGEICHCKPESSQDRIYSKNAG